MSAFGDYGRALRAMGGSARRYMLFTVLTSIAFSISNLNLNLYLHSLGYRPDFIGLLNGLPSLVVMALGLPLGYLADRKGYMPFLIFGTAISSVAALGTALSAARVPLLFFAILGGVAGSTAWVIGPPFLMSITHPRERVYLFSLQSAVMGGTGFLGSLIGGAIPDWVAVRIGGTSMGVVPLRAALLAMAFFNILALLPMIGLKVPKPVGDGAQETDASGPGQIGPDAAKVASTAAARPRKPASPLPRTAAELGLYLKLLAPQALVSLGAGAMVTFFQLFFNMRFNLTPERISPIFAFSAIATAVATLVAPLMAKRLGRVRTVVLTELASIPFLLTLAYSGNLAAAVSAYYLRGALMNMGGPIQQTFILEQVSERQRATLTSLGAVLGSMGRGGIGPMVSGYLQVVSGFGLAFTFTTVCYVVGMALFWWFFRNSERRAASPREQRQPAM
ncbi:MAG: MFS transporter [Bacillota bacterium]